MPSRDHTERMILVVREEELAAHRGVAAIVLALLVVLVVFGARESRAADEAVCTVVNVATRLPAETGLP